MEAFPKARNSWAPELIFDPATDQWVIFWSSSIEGVFTEDADVVAPGQTVTSNPPQINNRDYVTTTKDFRTFSPTRLLFDRGFSVIDATYMRAHGKLYIFQG